ncbi:hypothetical protein Cni_G19882 [Canna indica]|uniref:Reverse transcriptase n=1 Tax=Canna indica TaxID=4628 RepID=A0AAQ3QFP2_9LILI|nr:hypothetical protein Cni_G19882 [Canna indica]
MRNLEKLLTQELKKEEIYWRQKARVQWLHKGDRNTAYFHASVKERRNINVISQIKDRDDNWCEGPNQVADTAVDFYKELFSSTAPDNQHLLPNILTRVNARMNCWLLRMVSEDEVKKVAFSIKGDSARGEDGFIGIFFQSFWPLIGADIVGAISDFFRSRRLLKSINNTLLALIPKGKNIQHMNQV